MGTTTYKLLITQKGIILHQILKEKLIRKTEKIMVERTESSNNILLMIIRIAEKIVSKGEGLL